MNLQGLSRSAVEESRRKYGANTLTRIPPTPMWKRILEGFRDPMISILCVALIIQVILFVLGKNCLKVMPDADTQWYEPVGVLIAILIANGVASVSESRQEGKASALKAEEEARETAKVVREGVLQEIHASEVVVGDIIYLQAGDKIPADGEMIEGRLKVDQATLNGETEEATKIAPDGKPGYDPRDLLNRHYLYRGTVVCGGEGYAEIAEVGDRTLFGELALEVQETTRKTPLQVKLGKLANQISTFGYVGAIAIIIAIMLKTFLTGDPASRPDNFAEWVELIINAFTVAVTIIVCAVPEGLPMLTSILLSYQSLRMAKDNVLVRKINGLETAGSLSILFSDKTGTITEGRLSVVEVATGSLRSWSRLQFDDISPKLMDEIVVGAGVNNSAAASDGNIIGGNSTDRALMSFLADCRVTDRIGEAEVKHFEAFNSAKKTSSVTVDRGGAAVTYIKGAPEKILDRCTACLDENGQSRPLDSTVSLTAYIDAQAGRSMRMLAVAKCEGGDPEASGLTLICVLSIRDNVRKEAADAIREVQGAGIQVVMVTGDRRETAVAIATEAGLLKDPEDVALTSAEMAEMSDEALKEILPRLRVVARALPTDKSRLVRICQELDMVVGMTGDGVNDSPALKKADVGFAMGSGTEVAKEAGDITILDDNFSSIEKAILYGRTMFRSIRKFLIFQLTVNVAAVLTCFLAPLLGENMIMTVIQLLLVNLAMDTLAAIAFGSEPALKEYMQAKPIPRQENIVTNKMLVKILLAATLITASCLAIRFVQPFFLNLFGRGDLYTASTGLHNPARTAMSTYLNSAVFATFMMAITFNGFCARTEHLNILKHIEKNRSFRLVMGAIFLLQFVFVTFGGDVLHVTPLNAVTWLICLLIAFLVIPADLIRKILVRNRERRQNVQQ